MKSLLILFFIATGSLFAGWADVTGLTPGQKLEVKTTDGAKLHADFVSATQDSLVLQGNTVPKAQIREVKVYDRGRRLRRGFIWMGVGAAAGAGLGSAACVYCRNEGHPNLFTGPAAALGAALGALGFLSSPWKTIYK